MSSHVPLDLAGIWRGGCLDPSRSLLQVNWLSFKQVTQRPWAAQASTSSPACFIQGSLGTLEAAVSHLCSYSTEKLLLRPRRTQGSQTNRMPLIWRLTPKLQSFGERNHRYLGLSFPNHIHILGCPEDSASPCGPGKPCRPLAHSHHIH